MLEDCLTTRETLRDLGGATSCQRLNMWLETGNAFLGTEKISCGHMQVSQKAGLKWQLAICPPMSWLFRAPAKRKMVTLAWAALFCTICNNRTLHAEWSQSFAQLLEGTGALISSYSVFSTWGLQESPFTLLSSLAPCCHRLPKWYLKELNWALT